MEESEDKVDDKTKKQISHDAGVAHIEGLVQYLEEVDGYITLTKSY